DTPAQVRVGHARILLQRAEQPPSGLVEQLLRIVNHRGVSPFFYARSSRNTLEYPFTFAHSLHYHITTRIRRASLRAIQGFYQVGSAAPLDQRPDIRRRLATQKRVSDSAIQRFSDSTSRERIMATATTATATEPGLRKHLSVTDGFVLYTSAVLG